VRGQERAGIPRIRFLSRGPALHLHIAGSGMRRLEGEAGDSRKERDTGQPLSPSRRRQGLDYGRNGRDDQNSCDKKHGEILGVHIIGPHATELIAEAVLATELEATVEELAHTIHPHPTVSEGMGEAAMVLSGGALHLP